LKEMQCSQEIVPHRTGFEPGEKNHQSSIRLTLNITLYACHVQLRENGQFNILGWINQCRGVVTMDALSMCTLLQSISTVKYFAPIVGKCFNCPLTNT